MINYVKENIQNILRHVKVKLILGKAYVNLPVNDRTKYIKKAFNLYKEAVSIFTKKKYPLYWTMIQNNVKDAEILLSSLFEAWINFYSREFNNENKIIALFVDKCGNAFVTVEDGYYVANKGKWEDLDYLDENYVWDSQITTIKYDSSGNRLWIDHYHASNDSFLCFSPSDIIADKNENVYVVGTFESLYEWPGEPINYSLIIKYNRQGKKLFNSSIGCGRDPYLDIDEEGNIYVIGIYHQPLSTPLCLTIKYNNALYQFNLDMTQYILYILLNIIYHVQGGYYGTTKSTIYS